MPIREYKPSDLARLRALHAAQNFDYAFPDLTDPLFLTKLVLEEPASSSHTVIPGERGEARNPSPVLPAAWNVTDQRASESAAESGLSSPHHSAPSGSISAAVLLRLTCEAYLLLDPHSGTPSERWERIVALQEAAGRDAYVRGLSDAHCWLPPRIARRFGRRLAALGWLRDDVWTPFCKKL